MLFLRLVQIAKQVFFTCPDNALIMLFHGCLPLNSNKIKIIEKQPHLFLPSPHNHNQWTMF
jgi:hypothetical protein